MQKKTGENLKKKPLDTKKIFNTKRPTNQKKLNYSKNSNYLYSTIKSKQSVGSSFFSKKSDLEKIVNNISNVPQPNNQIYFEKNRDNLLQNNNSQNQIEEDCLVDNYNCLIPIMPKQIIFGHGPIVNKKQPKKTQTSTISTTKQQKASNILAMQGLEDNKKCKCKCWCY